MQEKYKLKEKQFDFLTKKQNYLLKSIGQIKTALHRYKVELDNMSESYEKRMRNVSMMSTERNIADPKSYLKKDKKTPKSKGKIVAITSSLWDTVILITHGIQKSVKSTEVTKDFSNIGPKDYKVKNIFEINHP